EIGVARRVDDVDARALPDNRGRLGEDGDAALAFEVVGVHGALGDLLVLAERAALLQQAVHQRRLAMVDVRDDRDVADVHIVFRRGLRAAVYTHGPWHPQGGLSPLLAAVTVLRCANVRS